MTSKPKPPLVLLANCAAAPVGTASGMKVGSGVRACMMTGSTMTVLVSAPRMGLKVPLSMSYIQIVCGGASCTLAPLVLSAVQTLVVGGDTVEFSTRHGAQLTSMRFVPSYRG